MSTTTNNTNELINELEINEITDAIVNAAKGNKPVKKSKKIVSLTDEIKSCFNSDKCMNESIASLEELIKAKVDAAIAFTTSQATTNLNKKQKTKDTKISEETNTMVLVEKKKRATKAKKVEPNTTTDVVEPITTDVVEPIATTSLVETSEKPKKKRAPRSVSSATDDAKPKKKSSAVKVKKTIDTEVSDSDSDEPITAHATEGDKPKKKTASKSKKVLEIAQQLIEPVKNIYINPIIDTEEDNNDDSSVKTSDFIEPLTITDELEEDTLSDIGEE